MADLYVVLTLAGDSWARIMIDDQILVSNRLLPNTKDRQAAEPTLGSSNREVDWRGGAFIYGTGFVTFPCVKLETVYIPGGTHSVDVGVRTAGSLGVHGGELFVEVVELNGGAQTNLPLLQSVTG